ncbi:hypothetical protein RHSIM_Rhsim08G0127900 [Rhododendron simsii]|uniref:Uncharacterized protein n=1 Tax=Rhododendron simsii TaxID=118357 RepID=A0A834GJC5_RHOSS|nr:hypothetical protein RHSIM_Rhsim08G0127900 [Rhododendron simsii]
MAVQRALLFIDNRRPPLCIARIVGEPGCRRAGSISVASSYSTGQYEHSHGSSSYENIQLQDDENREIVEYTVGQPEAHARDGRKEKDRCEDPEKYLAACQTKATSGQRENAPRQNLEGVKEARHSRQSGGSIKSVSDSFRVSRTKFSPWDGQRGKLHHRSSGISSEVNAVRGYVPLYGSVPAPARTPRLGKNNEQ